MVMLGLESCKWQVDGFCRAAMRQALVEWGCLRRHLAWHVRKLSPTWETPCCPALPLSLGRHLSSFASTCYRTRPHRSTEAPFGLARAVRLFRFFMALTEQSQTPHRPMRARLLTRQLADEQPCAHCATVGVVTPPGRHDARGEPGPAAQR
jgi:hypothetical protein